MEWIVWSVVGAVICGAVAAAKKRNVFGWVILGALFCIVSIIILLCLPKLEGESKRDDSLHVGPNIPIQIQFNKAPIAYLKNHKYYMMVRNGL